MTEYHIKYLMHARILNQPFCNFEKLTLITSELEKSIEGITPSQEQILPVSELVFDYPSQLPILKPYAGQAGWLELNLLKVDSINPFECLLFNAKTDEGEILSQEICEHLFQLPATIVRKLDYIENLDQVREQHEEKIKKGVQTNAWKHYEKFFSQLDCLSEKLSKDFESLLNSIENEIEGLNKSLKETVELAEKIEILETIQILSSQRLEKMRHLHREEDRIAKMRDRFINRFENELLLPSSSNSLFTIRWSISSLKVISN